MKMSKDSIPDIEWFVCKYGFRFEYNYACMIIILVIIISFITYPNIILATAIFLIGI